jgi:uncharacterized protein YgfB (UPF0149 family)
MSKSSIKQTEPHPDVPEMAYEDLAELFRRLGTGQTPTALHASLAGILAAGHRMSNEDWVHWALDLLAPNEAVTEGHHIVLRGLYVWTLQTLEDTGFGFKLLLPADDTPLDQRLDALSDWSGSFLGAFGSVGVVAEGQSLPEAVEEVLDDLSAIAQVDNDYDEGEQAEADFLAISEHVRLGVLTLFLEYNANAASDDEPPVVH